jgi:hypothetical protein
MKNPYLEQFVTLNHRDFDTFMRRRDFVQEFAWAVPSDEAIKAIIGQGPVVEIGAGNGYWASLIAQVGGDIVATDIGSEQFKFTKQWHPTEKLGALSAVEKYGANRALLSVWPCYQQHWATEALLAYQGDTFIYVGESSWGCTGDAELHAIREDETKWKETLCLRLPQWDGIHDELIVYKRVGS